jgi:C-terminal processing protease CtpA/Prc
VGPPQPYTVEIDAAKYGFALACRPSCTRTKGPDGMDYWKFDAEPPIVAVRPGKAAAAAGLKVGDKVVEIEGKPVLSREGARHLFTAQSQTSLTCTVERDGKRITYTMRLKK